MELLNKLFQFFSDGCSQKAQRAFISQPEVLRVRIEMDILGGEGMGSGVLCTNILGRVWRQESILRDGPPWPDLVLLLLASHFPEY
jgi:hypothetical protein